MNKKFLLIIFLTVSVLLFVNQVGALTLTDNTSTFSAFFNVTVADPGISYSQNYSLYVGLIPALVQP